MFKLLTYSSFIPDVKLQRSSSTEDKQQQAFKCLLDTSANTGINLAGKQAM